MLNKLCFTFVIIFTITTTFLYNANSNDYPHTPDGEALAEVHGFVRTALSRKNQLVATEVHVHALAYSMSGASGNYTVMLTVSDPEKSTWDRDDYSGGTKDDVALQGSFAVGCRIEGKIEFEIPLQRIPYQVGYTASSTVQRGESVFRDYKEKEAEDSRHGNNNNDDDSYYAGNNNDDPSPSTHTLTSANGSNTVTAGDSYTVTLNVPSGYTIIYWYIKPEDQAGYGTSQSTTTGGSSSTTSATYTYSIPSGVSGNYVLTAYTYSADSTIVEPTHTVSVRTQPSHPLSVTASPGPSRWSVSLSWAAPSSDGGSAITGYEYQYRRYNAGTSESWSSWQSVSSTSTTVTGLISNGTYEFRLRAVNSVGPGSITDSVFTTTAT